MHCWIQAEFQLNIFQVFLCLDIRHLDFIWGYSIEKTSSSREPVISSRSRTGTKMFCCASVFAPVHERAKVGNQARSSHGLCIIYLLNDHHASRDSLWMLRYCPSSECFGRVCGFAWFSFLWVRARECWEHQETTGWNWSPKSSFLAVFHFVHSHLGRGMLQQTGFARLHSVSPQILQTQKMWAGK